MKKLIATLSMFALLAVGSVAAFAQDQKPADDKKATKKAAKKKAKKAKKKAEDKKEGTGSGSF
jgi:ribosomal protein L12E/L44/L45/RPP1/RPP2